jgi:hypothetical protein
MAKPIKGEIPPPPDIVRSTADNEIFIPEKKRKREYGAVARLQYVPGNNTSEILTSQIR